MNKGIILFAIVLVGIMGLFFYTYIRDKVTPRPESVAVVPPPPAPAPPVPPVEPAPPPVPPQPSKPEPRVLPPEPVQETQTCTVAGQVLDRATGMPVPEFEIKLETATLPSRPAATGRDEGYAQVREPAGRFRLEGVDAGRGQLVVRARGFSPAFYSLKELAPGETKEDVVIRLEAAAGLDGTIQNALGGNVENALVFFGRMPDEATRERSAVARSDENGRFWCRIPASQSVTVIAWHADYAPAYVFVQPVEDEPTQCTIVLGEGATVEGLVTYGQQPIAGQRVKFKPQFDDIGFGAVAETGPDGRYVLANLPECDASITAVLKIETEAAERTRSWNNPIANGERVSVDFAFVPASGFVEGTISFDGDIPARASLSLLTYTDSGEEARYAQMAPDGTFRFDAVPPGYASVSVDGEDADGNIGYDEYRFRLQEGESRKIDFKLTRVDNPVPQSRPPARPR